MKINRNYLLFEAALCLNAIFVIFSRSIIAEGVLKGDGILFFIRLFIFFLLITKLFIDNAKLSLFTLFLIALLLVQSVISDDQHMLYLFLFALASKGVDIRHIGKILSWSIGVTLAFVVVLNIIGISDEIIMTRGAGGDPAFIRIH